MNCINYLFDKRETEDISNSLGNMMLSGVQNEGVDTVETALISNILNYNRTLVYVDSCTTHEKTTELSTRLSTSYSHKQIFTFSLSTKKDCLDILETFDSANAKSYFLMEIISLISNISETLKSKMRRIFYYAMDAWDALGRKYKFSDITRLDIDSVIHITNEAPIDDVEKQRRLRMLSDSTSYSIFFELEDCWDTLNIWKLDEAFSGDLNPKEIINAGNIVLVNGFLHEDKKSREIYVNAFMLIFKVLVESSVSTIGVSTILKHSDSLSLEVLGDLFELANHIDSKVYMFVEDVSRFISKYGNTFLDNTKSFMIFTQGSDENATFWSQFFGSRDMQQRSYSYTKKRSWNPFADSWNTGGVVESSRRYTSTTQNIQTVNKPIYPPEIFRDLKPKDVMIYLREPLIRRKSRIEG